MTNFFAVDSGGATRKAKRLFVVDAGGATRQVKRAFIVDSGGATRLIYQPLDTFSLVAGIQVTYPTVQTGYQQGVAGSCTPATLGDGGTLNSLYYTNATGDPGVWLVLTGLPSTPSASFVQALTIVGGPTFSGASASYFDATTDAGTWYWDTVTPPFTNGSTYTVTLQHS